MDITTVKGRSSLPPRREPYWFRVSKGCHIGYRKLTNEKIGSWIARYTSPTEGRSFLPLGQFECTRNANRFDAAKNFAQEWFDIIEQTGSPLQRTVSDACKQYVQSLKNKGSEEKAIADVQHRIERDVISDVTFASKPLASLTKPDFDKWRESIQYKSKASNNTLLKKASSTINRDMTVLRAAMNLAFENQWVTKNTWRASLKPISVRQDPTVEQCRMEYLTVAERRSIVEAVSPELAYFIKVLCLVPVRPGALAKLKVGDYDRRQRQLTIPSDKANPRSIHVSQTLDSLLRQVMKGKLPSAPLICTPDGGHWNKDKWKGPFKNAINSLDLPKQTVMYTIRHSVITDLIAKGIPVLTVAQLAGTSIKMIEKHYGKLLKADSISALESLAI